VIDSLLGRSAQTLIRTASWHLWVDIVQNVIVIVVIAVVCHSVSSDISAKQQKNEDRARDKA
jgi:hypothetical protein